MVLGQDVFQQISESQDLAGRFFNMLSLMEFIGARKIMKSQGLEAMDRELLSHLSEEIRHAQVFKKLALKCDPSLGGYSRQTVLSWSAAQNYMQFIDLGIAEKLGQSKTPLNYTLTTLVVEERANKVYPVLAELFARFGADGPLRTILREEESHLEDVLATIKSLGVAQSDLDFYRRLEDKAYQEILKGLRHDLDHGVGAVIKAPPSPEGLGGLYS